MADLEIAEILYESGAVRARYARVLSPDGARWIRHGLFRTYYEDGTLSSEGLYENGAEQGPWRTYHSNGRLASQGTYNQGSESDDWTFWSSDGVKED